MIIIIIKLNLMEVVDSIYGHLSGNEPTDNTIIDFVMIVTGRLHCRLPRWLSWWLSCGLRWRLCWWLPYSWRCQSCVNTLGIKIITLNIKLTDRLKMVILVACNLLWYKALWIVMMTLMVMKWNYMAGSSLMSLWSSQ